MVIAGVEVWMASDDNVVVDDRGTEVLQQRRVSGIRRGPGDSQHAVTHDIVSEHKPRVHLSSVCSRRPRHVRNKNTFRFENGVVLYHQAVRSIQHLKEPAALAVAVSGRKVFTPALSADLQKKIVFDENVCGPLAPGVVVPAENVDG